MRRIYFIAYLMALLLLPEMAQAGFGPAGLQGKRFLLFIGLVFLFVIYWLIKNEKINRGLGWSLLLFGVFYVVGASAVVLNTISMGRLFGQYYGLENPFNPKSPIYPAYEKFAQRLEKEDKYKQYYKETNTRFSSMLALDIAIRSGLRKLDEERLDRFAAVNLALLEKMGKENCAMIVRRDQMDKQEASELFISTLEKLEPAMIDEWFDVIYGAIMAQANKLPEPVIKKYKVEEAVNRLVDRWSSEDEQRLAYVLMNMNQADDRNVCWVGRTFFNSIGEVDQPYRAILIRIFMTGGYK